MDLLADGANLQFELMRAKPAAQLRDIPFGEMASPSRVTDNGFRVAFESGCTLLVTLDPRSGPFRAGVCTIESCDVDEPFIIVIRANLRNRTRPYFMVPGTLYGTNNADRGVIGDHPLETGSDPKLTWRGNRVKRFFSHSWHFRADHGSVPSVSANFDGRFVALGIEEASQAPSGNWVYNGLGLWTSAEHGDSISITIGALDWPGRFTSHQFRSGRVFEPLTRDTATGMSCRIGFHASLADDLFAYEPFIAAWYDRIHEPPRPGADLEIAMRDVAGALVEDGIDPEMNYFHMFMTPDGICDSVTLLAWAGVLQIARPLRRVAQWLDEQAWVDRMTDMIDRAIAESVSPDNGLFLDTVHHGKWKPNTWWPGIGQAALVNGHACYLLMKLASDTDGRPAWADTAQEVLARMVTHQRDDGRFPGGFDPEHGAPTTYETFGGCFLVAPLLLMHARATNPNARDAAIRAIEHYWNEFTRLEWVGTDMDCAGAVDSGSSYSLVRALVELHRQEGGEEVLDRIGHVLHYAFTYRLGHNTRHRHAPCDWSSCGSKVTSTQNVHLDAMGGEVLEDLLYFLGQRDDSYLRRRLADSLAWARQAYNRTEAEYGWGKVGYVTEQFYHTYDYYQSYVGDGAVWVGYFPWAAGSLLNAFLVEAMGQGVTHGEGTR